MLRQLTRVAFKQRKCTHPLQISAPALHTICSNFNASASSFSSATCTREQSFEKHSSILSRQGAYSMALPSRSYRTSTINSNQSHVYSDGMTHESLLSILKTPHPRNNIPANVLDKIGRNLHLQPSHPLGIIKTLIESYFSTYASGKQGHPSFKTFDNLAPLVDTKSCFDDLRVAPDHVSRKPTDTYYATEDTVLRTHTSAHQTRFISSGERAFLCTGDVYRRDEIDSSHYPVFHQMEGVRIYQNSDFPAGVTSIADRKKVVENDLKDVLTGLARHLFGKECEIRWREDYFPFTEPSFELEVFFQGDWLEVLGCGVIHDEVMATSGKSGEIGWAFGLGLERLAMVLFSIPDIRLFWSTDERFSSQFKAGKIAKFVPYSKFPMCYKDISFWLPPTGAHVNDVYDIIRTTAGDLVERVQLFDEFTHPKTGKSSQAYRVTYRHMDRSLTNAEVDEVQATVRQTLIKLLGVELRELKTHPPSPAKAKK